MTTPQDPAQTPAQPKPGSMQIGVGAQYIKDFSFESPNVPQIFAPTQSAPAIDMGVNVHTRNVGENTFEVLLALKMAATLESKTAFIAELSYGGIFVVPVLPDEQMKLFLLVEAPRLLFPFARSILATAVREGGFPQIVITPIDFMAIYMANKNNIGTMATAGAA
jgi:preprotein translocase subunit SecB